MTNGEKHIEKLLSWYKEAVAENGVCYLTCDDKNTLAYAIKCCNHYEDRKKDVAIWLRDEPSSSEKPNKSEIPTVSITKNDCAEQNGCITCSLDDGDDCCRKLYEESIQELPTKNDLGVDCISREDALMCLTGKFEIRGYEPSELVSIFSKRIKALSSVTPQEPIRPKGRWISYHYGAYYECSNCHERNNSRYDKYCKFCGAEMDGVEEK